MKPKHCPIIAVPVLAMIAMGVIAVKLFFDNYPSATLTGGLETEGARVFVNGKLVGKMWLFKGDAKPGMCFCDIHLSGGRYRLRVEKTGYKTLDQELSFSGDSEFPKVRLETVSSHHSSSVTR